FEFRRLAIAVEAFAGVRPAPQQRCASLAAGRTNKALRPTPLEQERRTARLVRKARLKLSQRSRPSHPVPPRARRRSPAHGTLILHIDQPGTAGRAIREGTGLSLAFEQTLPDLRNPKDGARLAAGVNW